MEVVPTTSAVSDSIDDLSNEEEEEERQPPVGRVGQGKFVWKTRQPNYVSSTKPALEGEIFTGVDVKRPIEYVDDQFDNDMKKNIVEQSNLYATQVNPNKPLGLDIATLEKFIGIIFLMSIVRMPRARMYWSLGLRFPKIADVMPLKRMLHISANLSYPANCTRSAHLLTPSPEKYAALYQERDCPLMNK